jgi:hypothetical protein
MEKKQTAVEWLYDTIIILPESIEDLAHNARSFKQAQQMFEEQIIDAHEQGRDDFLQERHYNATYGKGYYNETYGK